MIYVGLYTFTNFTVYNKQNQKINEKTALMVKNKFLNEILKQRLDFIYFY